jgi:hypothetical protein
VEIQNELFEHTRRIKERKLIAYESSKMQQDKLYMAKKNSRFRRSNMFDDSIRKRALGHCRGRMGRYRGGRGRRGRRGTVKEEILPKKPNRKYDYLTTGKLKKLDELERRKEREKQEVEIKQEMLAKRAKIESEEIDGQRLRESLIKKTIEDFNHEPAEKELKDKDSLKVVDDLLLQWTTWDKETLARLRETQA